MWIVGPKQQAVSIDTNLVTICQRPTCCDLATVDRRAVSTVAVLQDKLLADRFDSRVDSRHSGVVKHNLAFSAVTTDQCLMIGQLNQLLCTGFTDDLKYRHHLFLAP